MNPGFGADTNRLNILSILAVTDFSVDSRHAAHRAAMLAATMGIKRATLLHVIDQSWLDALKELVTGRGKELNIPTETAHALASLSQEVRKRSRCFLEPQIRIGSALDEIIHAASEFDLLVLGARGFDGVRSLALGTTSYRLLSKMRKPVLVVKRKPVNEYRNVLVAVDFSPNSMKTLLYSRAVAPDALLSLVHVYQPLSEGKLKFAGISNEALEEYRVRAHLNAEEEMMRFIEAAGMTSADVFRKVEYGHAPGKLLDIVLKWSPDLVAVGKHGGSPIEELLLGSITRYVLAQSRSDVLVAE